MDEYQTRRSPTGERFIGMFESPSTPLSSPTEPSYIAGDELHEDDFLFSSPDAAPPQPDGPRSPGRGAPQGHLGLLAGLALHEGDKRLLVRGGHDKGVAAAASAGMLLRRKATIAAAAASASASVASRNGGALSPTQSPTSSARAIPATAKPQNAGPAPTQQSSSSPLRSHSPCRQAPHPSRATSR
jgi:hypothetical protein